MSQHKRIYHFTKYAQIYLLHERFHITYNILLPVASIVSISNTMAQQNCQHASNGYTSAPWQAINIDIYMHINIYVNMNTRAHKGY